VIWVGYGFIVVALLWLLVCCAFAALWVHEEWQEHKDRRTLRRSTIERSKTRHPARSRGPEDEPRWKEWSNQ